MNVIDCVFLSRAGNLDFKKKKELQKKATAGSSHNWNTLFLGQNAVAEAIAAAYNTTKEKVSSSVSSGNRRQSIVNFL